MSTRSQGLFWIVAAAALFGWTAYDYSLFKPVLGALALIYGVLLILKDRIIQQRVELSQEELTRFGDKLSEATPLIVELLKKGRHVSVIAKQVKKSLGIPEDITLKYIIALGKYQDGRTGRERLDRANEDMG